MTIRPELIDELLKECSDPREVLYVQFLDDKIISIFFILLSNATQSIS